MYSQEFSPLSIKEQLFFRESQPSVQDQLNIANEKVNQLMQYQQQLSEELERMNMLYREQQLVNKVNPDETKFMNCVMDMVKVCHPNDKHISLKYAWKWLKFVVDDYIELKKRSNLQTNRSEIFKNGKKDSIVVGELLKKNCQVTESQYLKHSNCR